MWLAQQRVSFRSSTATFPRQPSRQLGRPLLRPARKKVPIEAGLRSYLSGWFSGQTGVSVDAEVRERGGAVGRASPQPERPSVLATTEQCFIQVAVWQGAAVPGDTAANFAQVEDVVTRAAVQGVEIVLFPELFLSGYDCSAEQLRAVAVTQQDPVLREVARVARETGVCVALPYAERCKDTGAVYNACVVFDCAGHLVKNYRKVNLWGPWEAATFSRGQPSDLSCCELRLSSGRSVRAGVLICYDIEFPEPARQLAVEGAELLLVPTALGAGDVEATTPTKVVPTRALENHVFVLYSNLEGPARDVPDQNVASFCGRSAVVGPDGEDLVRGGTASRGEGALLVATLALHSYAATVARNPYLADRAARLEEGHYLALSPAAAPHGPPEDGDAGTLSETTEPCEATLRLHEIAPDTQDAAEAWAEQLRVQPFLRGLPYEEFAYDSQHPCQFLRVYLPEAARAAPGRDALPVVALVHGGFWKNKWHLDNTQSASLVRDLLVRGFAVALVEYRRRDMPGGMYPGPEDDVAAAVQHLAEVAAQGQPLDTQRVVVMGHSAGATLAMAACRRAAALPTPHHSEAPPVRPALCVAVAGVADMAEAYAAKLSDEGDAAERYMGCRPTDSAAAAELYGHASETSYVGSTPPATPTLLVVGTADVDVPPRFLEDYYERCRSASTASARTTAAAEDPSASSGSAAKSGLLAGCPFFAEPTSSSAEAEGVAGRAAARWSCCRCRARTTTIW